MAMFLNAATCSAEMSLASSMDIPQSAASSSTVLLFFFGGLEGAALEEGPAPKVGSGSDEGAVSD